MNCIDTVEIFNKKDKEYLKGKRQLDSWHKQCQKKREKEMEEERKRQESFNRIRELQDRLIRQSEEKKRKKKNGN